MHTLSLSLCEHVMQTSKLIYATDTLGVASTATVTATVFLFLKKEKKSPLEEILNWNEKGCLEWLDLK